MENLNRSGSSTDESSDESSDSSVDETEKPVDSSEATQFDDEG